MPSDEPNYVTKMFYMWGSLALAAFVMLILSGCILVFKGVYRDHTSSALVMALIGLTIHVPLRIALAPAEVLAGQESPSSGERTPGAVWELQDPSSSRTVVSTGVSKIVAAGLPFSGCSGCAATVVLMSAHGQAAPVDHASCRTARSDAR